MLYSLHKLERLLVWLEWCLRGGRLNGKPFTGELRIVELVNEHIISDYTNILNLLDKRVPSDQVNQRYLESALTD
jgi:hypothetical protein